MTSAYELLTTPRIGATALAEGGVEFRVWAPNAERASVVLDEAGSATAMEREDRGYHAITIAEARPGTRYRIALDGGAPLPDPASRLQPEGVHGPSQVVAPLGALEPFEPPALRDLVLYEAHVGTASPSGTFDGLVASLDDLTDLGITALELMPVSQFPGVRNWGYDGVFPYAVHDSYGGPKSLRALVDECHRRGLAVVLDIVFNHAGPEGNVLSRFGPYFTDRYRTPWGDAVNFDDQGSDEVRRFFGGSALMWLEEFGVDALRVDAIHGIFDFTARTFLQELAEATRELEARTGRRRLLIPESPLNDPRVVTPLAEGGMGHDAHWNDDFHHAVLTVLTGDRSGYYGAFGELEQVATAMRDGYVYAGQHSPTFGRRHGAPSSHLPPERFVVFAENHDQVGNRMRGERLSVLTDPERHKLAAGLVMLSPYVPLLFQGQEYGETAPFPYFISHGDEDLVAKVREGRRRELASFGWEEEPPDPQDENTFESARLNRSLAQQSPHEELRELHKQLLRLRREHPALATRTRGDMAVIMDDDAPVMLMRRRGGDRQAFAAFNLSAEPQRLRVESLPGRWSLLVDSADQVHAGPGKAAPDELAGDTRLTLAPWSFALYDLAGE